MWGRIKARFKSLGFANLKELLEVLLVPVVLALGGLLLTVMLENQQEATEERRAENQLNAEDQRAQDAALESYFDDVSSHLTAEERPADFPSASVRARTLTLLERLDGQRKGSVLRLLGESHLIDRREGDPFVDLTDADLTEAYLLYANLAGATLTDAFLTDANLSNADLTDAYLFRADLTDAYLFRADLTDAYLTDAYLTGADLTDAYLTDADLTNADLQSAIGLTQSQVDDAIGNPLTQLPDDLQRPVGWDESPAATHLALTLPQGALVLGMTVLLLMLAGLVFWRVRRTPLTPSK
jgi:uncharacterized protein YjbI with pentapeptide repeats